MGTAVSFKLGNFAAGGGLVDGEYLLQKHTIENWDYGGKGSQTIALHVRAVPGKATGKNFAPHSSEGQDQYYSIGDPTAFGPDPTGTKVVAIGTRAQLSNSSNFFIFLENLVNAGFPEDKFDNDVSVFDGMVVRITNIPAPKRSIASNVVAQGDQSQQRERTIPVVSAVIKLPWESGNVATKAAAPAKAAAQAAAPAQTQAAPAAAAPAAGGGTPEENLGVFLATVLNGAASLQRTQARVQVFKAMSGSLTVPDRDAALKIFNDDNALSAVLAGIGDGYYVEGTEIKKIG